MPCNNIPNRLLIQFRLTKPLLKWRNITTTQEAYEPVDLSYATYENTRSYIPDEVPAPLIVMHGLFGSKANWNSHCKAFHQQTIPQRKVISIDARNHGDSPHTVQHTYQHLVEDLRALLERLGLKKAALLGHSMGGRTMMLFALQYVSNHQSDLICPRPFKRIADGRDQINSNWLFINLFINSHTWSTN